VCVRAVRLPTTGCATERDGSVTDTRWARLVAERVIGR
jgi:hypothetical protein